jgi:hypothetical protein
VAALEALAASFEPMPGRPMTASVVLPAGLAANPVALHPRVRRAIAIVRTLAPKG